MRRRLRARISGDNGQVMLMVGLLMFVLIGMAGMAVDVGSIFLAKAQLASAADAAALAAASDMPNTAAAQASAEAYVSQNDPSADLDPLDYPSDGQVRTSISKLVRLHFLPVIPGIKSMLTNGEFVRITANAVAGSGSSLDMLLAMDDTGSMSRGCNSDQSNAACPVKEARDGGSALLSQLGLGDPSGQTQGGLVPFRGCYDNGGSRCVGYPEIVDLTTNASIVQAGIDGLHGEGGSGTNICRGLEEAATRIVGSGSRPGARKAIVLLTDADNNPTTSAGSAQCEPSGSSFDQKVNDLDGRAYDVAKQLKLMNVEIFVVGYDVAGNPDNATCDEAAVGTGSDRPNTGNDPMDRNLARCIASSATGTNDHYFEAPRPQDLPSVFRSIGSFITTRLVE